MKLVSLKAQQYSITKTALHVWNKRITMLCFISNLQQRQVSLSLNQFSMLVLYRKINSNIAEFVGYVPYLTITKRVDLILGYFNENCLWNERPITTSLQSLGLFKQFLNQLISRVPVLIIFISEITKTASQTVMCYLIVFIFLTIIQLFYTVKIGW